MNQFDGYIKTISEHLQGQTMTEYVLILAAIAAAEVTAYTLLGGFITRQLSNITSAF